jgi:hypothetical protein
MELPPEDFESSASTSFTTPARDESYTNLLLLSSKNRLLENRKSTKMHILSPLRVIPSTGSGQALRGTKDLEVTHDKLCKESGLSK